MRVAVWTRHVDAVKAAVKDGQGGPSLSDMFQPAKSSPRLQEYYTAIQAVSPSYGLLGPDLAHFECFLTASEPSLPKWHMQTSESVGWECATTQQSRCSLKAGRSAISVPMSNLLPR